MPVVRGDDDNGVDILVIEQLAVVDVLGDFFVAVLEFPGFEIQELRVHIAKRNDPNAGHPREYIEMLLALFAETYYSQANIIVCPQDPRRGACTRR